MNLDWNKIFAVLALLVTLLAGLASAVEAIDPKIAGYCLLASGVISAFLKEVRPKLGKSRAAKKIMSLALVASVVAVSTACPAQSDFVKAFNASKQIAQHTELAARTIGDLYTAKIIDYRTKEKLARQLKTIATNGKRFHQTVDGLYKTYKTKLPGEQINALDIAFNAEVIAPFLELLQEAGVLTGAASEKVFLAIALLRTAILAVAQFFGRARQGSASYQFYVRENYA